MKNKILNRLKRMICGFAAIIVCFSLFSFTSKDYIKKDTVVNNSFKLKTIIVDAGHGGKKTGAFGSYSVEKNVTLAIALKLQKAIEKEMNDVNVIMTRTTDDDIAFRSRADIANSNHGNVFISIHCNSLSDRRRTEIVGYKKGKRGKKIPIYKTVSVPDRSGKGPLLLVYSTKRIGPQIEALRENAELYEDKNYKEQYNGYDPDDPASVILLNAFKNKYRKQSIHLANLINTEFTDGDGRRSEGVREQVLFVLDHTAMPSVLVETGYINNHDDEEYLNSEAGQNEIVNSIVRALINYKKEVEQVVTQ
ncbi:N-acetylmuramoyl-L-alanine amidase [Mucilaginibacter sp.]|jgi:N-acetylmuramoyl-L-alanine amidase|uniref:N-acetylmuramoyl-L-alanine amidase family protein n=1 Tax=Mucilaginibacter sp. TaxID=1882438 RepID=UPI002617CA2F|nr:N-acetylmuramoyl-L-alanine amidase [Mucilaginibacter sp.]MDB5128909.1 N-acetylmuramoyl-L-alanine amidase [Mucilaginibacter sp.]